MQRRRFIQITAAGALALGLPSRMAAPSERLLHDPELLTVFGSGRPVREIGQAYRAAFPREDSAHVLSNAILSDNSPDANLRERLTRRVRQDFERGHIVQINGWILSRTEARQCALYSIAYS